MVIDDDKPAVVLDREQWKLLDDIHSFRVPRLVAPGANHAVLAEAGYIEYHMEGGTVVITVLDAGIQALANREVKPAPDPIIDQIIEALQKEEKNAVKVAKRGEMWDAGYAAGVTTSLMQVRQLVGSK